MKFKPTHSLWCAAKGPRFRGAERGIVREQGFTLAEALAAMAFLAIVIPVSVQGLRVANQAGQVAMRKMEAARVADRLLNEAIVSRQWQSGSNGGTVQEGAYAYRWQLKNQDWSKDSLKLVSINVTYTVQGMDYDVHLTTLMDATQP